MVESIRKKYNSEFSEEKYQIFLKSLYDEFNYEIDFRLSETPIFLTDEFRDHLLKGCNLIVDYLTGSTFKEDMKDAMPPGLEVPNEDEFTNLLAIDFAICDDGKGGYIPQLIELQGFASLYCYQELLNKKVRENFDIPENYTHYFNGLNHESYVQRLKEVIIGDSNPKNVILLEIEPEKQKTRIDFLATEKYLGIRSVCLTDIQKEGKKLYYNRDGEKTYIERIYNRVIYDELKNRSDIKYNFRFTEELDVKWIAHPNWFFKISKYTIPYLKNEYVPPTEYLDEVKEIPQDLENYVVKPLFSFAGAGVIFDVTKEIIDDIPQDQRHNYILQKKVKYAEAVETLDVPAKAEVRMLLLRKEGEKRPEPAINLVRMTKGKMVGVNFNKDKTWIGSSIAYFKK